jgi:electron transfer flavoprotein alpha subunit
MALDTIWVYAQSTDGAPTTGTLELLTKARSLGATNLCAIHAGGDGQDVAAKLGAYGVSKLYCTGDLGERLPGVAVAGAIAALIEREGAPGLILFNQTYEARDVVARLSVKLDRTVLTNNTDIVVDGDSVSAVTTIFGGNTLVTTKFTGPAPYLAMFRPKSFAAEEGGAAAGELVMIDVPEPGQAGAARRTASHVEETTGPKLDEAEIVVSGGRGLGEAGKYELIEQLAKLLKGAPGASRAIVDAGWVPYSYQVGQTGKVVKPTVYIAAGISGATQHMVGMKGSKNIIAINKDKEAPIFSIADLGIVGDVHKVLPKLIEALQGR